MSISLRVSARSARQGTNDRSKRSSLCAPGVVSNFSNTMRERRSEPLLDFEEFLTETNRQTIALVQIPA